MELIIDFIIGAISSVCIGFITNYIYDKIKNHSSSTNRKSGLEFEFKVNLKMKERKWENNEIEQFFQGQYNTITGYVSRYVIG